MNLNKIFKLYVKYDIVSIVECISTIVFLLPRIRAFNYLKSKYLRLFFSSKIGKRVTYYPGAVIFTGRKLKLGDDVDIARGVQLYTDGGIDIGSRVLIGFNSMIISTNHRIPQDRSRIFESGYVHKQVVIEDDVWVGGNCTILPGVTIGEGAVVAAGSVVTKNVAPFTIVAGIPAKKIASRL